MDILTKFFGDIDTIEQNYGLGAKLSWRLIEYIDYHKSKSKELLGQVDMGLIHGALPDNVQFKDVDDLWFSFNKMSPGIRSEGYSVQEIKDKRTGTTRRVVDSNLAERINLAFKYMENTGEFDFEEIYQKMQEIDQKNDKLKSINDDLQALKVSQISGVIGDKDISDNEQVDKVIVTRAEEARELSEEIELLSLEIKEKYEEAYATAEKLKAKKIRNISELTKSLAAYRKDFRKFVSEKGYSDSDYKDLDESDKKELKDAFGKDPFDYNTPTIIDTIGDKVYGIESSINDNPDRSNDELASEFEVSSDQIAAVRSRSVVNKVIDDILKRVDGTSIPMNARYITEVVEDELVKLGVDIESAGDIFQMVSDRMPKSSGNMIDFVKNFVKHYKKSGENKEISDEELVQKMHSDSGLGRFIAGMSHAIVAKLEYALLTQDQVRMQRGGGFGTSLVSRDINGVTTLPPGFDIGTVFGERSNPYHVNAVLVDENNEYSRQIKDLNDTLQHYPHKKDEIQGEIADLEESIKHNNNKMDFYRKILDNNRSREIMSMRAEVISENNNPYLPENKDKLEELMVKMSAHVPGIKHTGYDKPDLRYIEEWTDEEKGFLRFLHENTPLMNTMGTISSMIANRYMWPVKRSIDEAEMDRMSISTNKDLNEITSMAKANVIKNIEDYERSFGDYEAVVDYISNEEINGKSIKELLINKIDSSKYDPVAVIKKMIINFTDFFNGTAMRGGMVFGHGRQMAMEKFKKDILWDYPVGDDDDDEIDMAIDKIIDKALEIYKPTPEEIEARRTRFADVSKVFADMSEGLHILVEDGDVAFQYDSNGVESILRFLQSLSSINDPDSYEFKAQIKDAVDYMSKLEQNRDAEQIYSDISEIFALITDLDKLGYLSGMVEYYSIILNRETGEGELDPGINNVSNELEDAVAKLDDHIEYLRDKNIVVSDTHGARVAEIAMWRGERLSRMEAIISKQVNGIQDVPNSMLKAFNEFKNAADASALYWDNKYKHDTAVIPGDKQKYKERMDQYRQQVMAIGVSDSDSYKKRIVAYNKIINARNEAFNKFTPGAEKQFYDSVANIAKSMMLIKQKFDVDDHQFADELSKKSKQVGLTDASDVIERLNQQRKIRRDLEQKAQERTPFEALLWQQEVDAEGRNISEFVPEYAIKIIIHPRSQHVDYIESIVNKPYKAIIPVPRGLISGDRQATMMLSVKNKPIDFTIRLDRMGRKNEELYDYLDRNDSAQVMIMVGKKLKK
jgi:hypothetical protein